MNNCPTCHGALRPQRLSCDGCGLSFEGRFAQARLARLGPEDLRLAEEILLAAGNLKQVAGVRAVSYPTLKKQVNQLVETLEGLRRDDDAQCRAWLDAVEAGRLAPDEAARLIEELNGAT